MARTAPVPNIPAIPGMNPGLFVLGGGGDGGGSGAGGGKGKGGKQGAGGKNGGQDANGGGKGAPDPQRYPHCGTESHPVDFSTGRAFTHPILIVALPGPLPLRLSRSYSTSSAHRDMGLGFGWSHDLSQCIEETRRTVVVWTGLGTKVTLDVRLAPGQEKLADFGYRVRRETWGYVVDPNDGKTYTYADRDENGAYRLTKISDRNGNTIQLRYDGPRLAEVDDSAGRTLRFRYGYSGRIAAIEGRNSASSGQWVTFESYEYDESGNLARATDSSGFSSRYAYDEDHRLTEDTDRTGLCFHFRYDDQGRCVESWGDYPGREDPSLSPDVPALLASGRHPAKGVHHCVFEYLDGATQVIDSRCVRTFEHNELGLLTKSADGPGIACAQYDERGFLIFQENKDGTTESMTRDERGELLSYTDPAGETTAWERDSFGLATKVSGPLGYTSQMERDLRGNPVRFIDALGQVATFGYDARGLRIESVTKGGARCRYEYDAQGNLTQILLPNGGKWQFRYDEWGHLAELTDPVGAVTRYSFSVRGDLLAVYDAGGGLLRYTYDGEGHVTHIDAPNGAHTELSWGGYHKIVARKSPAGDTLRLYYDREGALTRVVNEKGETHEIELDIWGRAVRERTFDGRGLSFKLDNRGRPIRIVREAGDGGPEIATDLVYDAMGRVVEVSSGDEKESFVRDPYGNVIEAISASAKVVFHRDALGRIVRETQHVGGEVFEVASAYDAHDMMVGRRSSTGHTEVVARDVSGARLRTLLDGSLSFDHQNDILGRETARKLPGGGTIETRFDPLGRLLERRALGPSSTVPMRPGEPDWVGPAPEGLRAQLAFQYDPAGELLARFDRARGLTEYEHDRTGRLLKVEAQGKAREVFRHSPSGDLYEAGSAPVRDYDQGGRLVRKGDTSYAWDGAGRLIERKKLGLDGTFSVWRYGWSDSGRLVSVDAPNGDRVELAYDALSRRTIKRCYVWDAASMRRTLAREVKFVWERDKLLHEITKRIEASSAETDPVVEVRTFCYEDGSFSPAAHREPDGRWVHYLNDAIGTPERLLDGSGAPVGELSRDAFRLSEAENSEVNTPLRFPGQYEDRETGLCYNRYRYYDPDAGLYISPDPLGLVGGLHAYLYGTDPLLWLDPWGLAYARSYSLGEVQQMISDSEGRPSPTTGKDGHPQSEHVQVPRGTLQDKSCNGKTKTSFSSTTTQARATQAVLNSPQGQAALAQLDTDPTVNRVVITAPLPHPVTVSQSVDGSRPERVQATQATVVVDRLPGPGDQAHVQTSFGS